MAHLAHLIGGPGKIDGGGPGTDEIVGGIVERLPEFFGRGVIVRLHGHHQGVSRGDTNGWCAAHL